MNYIKITKSDIANGAGVRCVLWVSGCDVCCDECHNKESWDFNAGQAFTAETMKEIGEALKPSYITGLTISGGHPLAPQNIDCVKRVVSYVYENFPEKNIWLYTGYQLNQRHFTMKLRGISPENIHHNKINEVLGRCDVVVDGAFDKNLRDISLQFRGSSNQRIIDVRRTIECGRIVTIPDSKWTCFKRV